jgi:tellurite methyltransferase
MTTVEPSRDWPRYYKATSAGAARPTLLQALARFAKEPPPAGPRFAVDLGCGAGRDTRELLERGWRVLAIDNERRAIERVLAQSTARDRARLEALQASFEDASWSTADLVNASFALPFCQPHVFSGVWTRLVESLRPGGRFAGQLFGDRDSWSGSPTLTILNRDQVLKLLHSFEIEVFEEEDRDGPTALGAAKHWHIFHVVARTVGSPASS